PHPIHPATHTSFPVRSIPPISGLPITVDYWRTHVTLTHASAERRTDDGGPLPVGGPRSAPLEKSGDADRRHRGGQRRSRTHLNAVSHYRSSTRPRQRASRHPRRRRPPCLGPVRA